MWTLLWGNPGLLCCTCMSPEFGGSGQIIEMQRRCTAFPSVFYLTFFFQNSNRHRRLDLLPYQSVNQIYQTKFAHLCFRISRPKQVSKSGFDYLPAACVVRLLAFSVSGPDQHHVASHVTLLAFRTVERINSHLPRQPRVAGLLISSCGDSHVCWYRLRRVSVCVCTDCPERIVDVAWFVPRAIFLGWYGFFDSLEKAFRSKLRFLRYCCGRSPFDNVGLLKALGAPPMD